ncbi:acyltransferase family protein [Nocardioides speluncae]|uniref:acyltransferase family protein n=1 Tax=Nocardioides speluncae TaxID=2670337 RepID=UPI00137A21F8|nr:acyltransferase family protein [Nocardioides speluncae]
MREGTGNGLRTDIQGLRAIAVLTVLLSHAGVPFLPGGYVGVDVFFVISGYLITGLLVAEAGRAGAISLGSFYARRARRIIPAATVVIVVTVAATVIWASLIDAVDVVYDGVWAALFAANIRFGLEGVDYFAQDETASPLQHYWSLAVEEQFYLVWPLVIMAVLAMVARRRGSDDVVAGSHPPAYREPLLVVLAVICTASLAWSAYQTGVEPGSAYFSTLTRAWELGIGAFCAIAGASIVRDWTQRARELGAGIGVVGIAISCVVYDETTAFPGAAALLPVLATGLLLLAGQNPGKTPTFTALLLSVRPMRVIGDWSYSLYLWHWPLLVVPALYLARDLTPWETALAVAAAFVLAGASYRWVETPFREPGRFAGLRWMKGGRALLIYPASATLVLATCGAGWAWTERIGGEHGDEPAITTANFGTSETKAALPEDDTKALVAASVLAARNHVKVPSDLTPDLLDLRDDVADVGDCDYSYEDVRDLCLRGDEDADRTMVVVGDSHGRHWIPAFDEIAEQTGYAVYYLVKPQCTAALVEPARVGTNEEWPDCPEFHEWMLEQVDDLDPELVVVSTASPTDGIYAAGERVDYEDEPEVMRAGFTDLYDALEPLADEVVVVGDVPKLPEDPATCLSSRPAHLGECMSQPDERAALMTEISRETAVAAGLRYVDPKPWLCHREYCPMVIGSTLPYRDPGHLTTTYASELAEPLGRALHLW